MAGESKASIVAAVIGNICIAAVKFVAAAHTGSSAMLSEGIHSLVDTGNGLLMWLGLRRAARPADAEHPFGYGRELYFWTLIVAIGMFAVGGGLSIYEGIERLRHPEPIVNPAWSYGVLAAAALFEGVSGYFGWRAFRKIKRRKGVLETIHASKDPSSFTVLLEDSAALAGLAIAVAGVVLGQWRGSSDYDAGASVIIGALLAAMASVLAYETKGLLIGEAMDAGMLREIRGLVAADPAVARVRNILTLYFGPHDVLLALELDFRTELPAAALHDASRRLTREIRRLCPDIGRVYFGVPGTP